MWTLSSLVAIPASMNWLQYFICKGVLLIDNKTVLWRFGLIDRYALKYFLIIHPSAPILKEF
jgi:hypothetical protein